MSEQPTDEQIKEFWEGCGFRVLPSPIWRQGKRGRSGRLGATIRYIYPDSSEKSLLPHIDLNNLFKYAVPKLQDDGYMVELYSYEQKGYEVAIYHLTGQVEIPIVITTDEDPALALFWALWQIKEKSNE